MFVCVCVCVSKISRKKSPIKSSRFVLVWQKEPWPELLRYGSYSGAPSIVDSFYKSNKIMNKSAFDMFYVRDYITSRWKQNARGIRNEAFFLKNHTRFCSFNFETGPISECDRM